MEVNYTLNRYWHEDKTAELALFYNLAYDRIASFIAKENKINKKHVESIIKNFDEPDSKIDLSQPTYIKLKGYLWKGYEDDRNSCGTAITHEEIAIVKSLLTKLFQIRNFQSHYYHSNEHLKFSHPVKVFINKLYQNAQDSLAERYPAEIKKYKNIIRERHANQSGREELFISIEDEENLFWITREGKNFLLSLYLTKGEMTKFLKQRKYCKRDDTKEYKIKHEIYTFLCHRDAASRFHYNQKQKYIDNNKEIAKEILKIRQLYKLNTYLNDVPQEITNPELFPLYINGIEVLTIPDLISFCNIHGFFKPMIFHNGNEIHSLSLEFSLTSHPHIKFKISKRTFNRIILDIIRKGEDDILCHFNDYLSDRQNLYVFLKTGKRDQLSELDDTSLIKWLNDYEIYKLKSNHVGLRTKFSKWFTHFIESSEKESRFRQLLIEKLETLPVELKYIDFYNNEDCKPRTETKFMRFAVQYLIDHNVTPNWNWHWTSNQVHKETLKERTCFSCQQPNNNNEDWRLKFTYDNQILISLSPEKRSDKNEPVAQRFLLGHKAMRNLLIAHFDDEKRNIKDFFNSIELDVKSLYTSGQNIRVIDDRFIPQTFKESSGEDIRIQVLKRINFLINLFETLKVVPFKPKRETINRQIMRCYRLFDWGIRKSNGVEIFLRKHEYKKLSIYHYNMENKKLNYLLAEICKSNDIPPLIMALLRKCRSLDELFIETINATVLLLNEKRLTVENLETSSNNLNKIAKKLGVPVYSTSKSANTHVPYDIHPTLILKVFYKKAFSVDHHLNLSSKVWDDQVLKSKLSRNNYAIENYLNHTGDSQTFKNARKKEIRKVIGAINELKTYDGLLFKIATKYDPKYTSVKNMHENEVILYDSISDKKEPIISGDRVKVTVKYKQLSDILVSMSDETIKRLINWMLNNTDKEKLNNKLIHENDGSLTIPFIDLKTEMERIYHHSMSFIEAVFNFEKTVIEANLSDVERLVSKEKGSNRLVFDDILQLSKMDIPIANLMKIKNFRDSALHVDIPQDNIYNVDSADNLPVLFDFLKPIIERKKEQRYSFYQADIGR
jgi:hypothetical protein